MQSLYTKTEDEKKIDFVKRRAQNIFALARRRGEATGAEYRRNVKRFHFGLELVGQDQPVRFKDSFYGS